MSQEHVHAIMCPAVERERDRLREDVRAATSAIVQLRLRLRDYDPSLPNEYDGNLWVPLEKPQERL